MTTCKTCRWWQQQDEHDHHTGPDDLALRDPETHERISPQPFDLRQCASPKVRFYERPEQDGAALLDGSQYHAVLVTGPDFGCIHWSPLTGETK